MRVQLPDRQVIEVHVQRSARKTLAISVYPNGGLEVRAPEEASEEQIAERLHRRRRWISRQQEFFEQFKPRTTPRQYVSGETHLYLGRQYRLKVISGDKKNVRLWAGYLEVTLPVQSPELVRRVLQGWYRGQASRQFESLLTKQIGEFHRKLPENVRVEARSFEKRWGTCHPDGRISLNIDLIRAPRSCIEYVIAHELCHLLVPDHSKAFFRILEGHLPDWQSRKLKLERFLS